MIQSAMASAIAAFVPAAVARSPCRHPAVHCQRPPPTREGAARDGHHFSATNFPGKSVPGPFPKVSISTQGAGWVFPKYPTHENGSVRQHREMG